MTILTLEEAKTHLRVVDAWHDAEVQAALDDADAIIRRRLKTGDDPTWDAVTVPRDIKAAAKLLLGHLYEHRGDAFGPANDNDAVVWTAIDNLIVSWRDPALA